MHHAIHKTMDNFTSGLVVKEKAEKAFRIEQQILRLKHRCWQHILTPNFSHPKAWSRSIGVIF